MKEFRGEVRYVRKGGGRVWVNLTASVVRDPEGKPLYIVTLFQDITERKRAEEALRQSEERYRELVESSPYAMVVYQDGEIVLANAAAVTLAGARSAGDLVGREVLSFIHPDSLPAASGRMEAATRGEVQAPTTEKLLTLDGRVLDVEVSSVPFTLRGRPAGLSMIEDVTEVTKAQAALRESEERFRSAFENSPMGVALCGLDGRWFMINSVMCKMLGYPEEELVGREFQDLTYPDDLGRNLELFTEARQGRRDAYELEKRYVRKDGVAIWARLNASLVRDADGRPLYLVTQIQDITERRRMEEALRQSEEKYRELVEKASSIIIRTDREGRLTSFNEYAEKFFGFSREEVIGKSFPETIVPGVESTGRDLTTLMAEIIASPESYRLNVNENVKKDGERVWVQWSNTVVRDPQGRPDGVLCVGTDITEAIRHEEALAESEARFRATFENAAVGMAISSPDGTWTSVNMVLAQMLGYPREELVGRKYLEFLHPDDREESVRLRSRLYSGESSEFSLEQRYVTKEGGTIWALTGASVVRSPAGTPLYTVVLMEDITDRKEAEGMLQEYSRRLEERVKEETRDLEVAHAKLLEAEKQATLGTISTQVAHDLRNPLASINTGLYYLKSALDGEQKSAVVQTMRDHGGLGPPRQQDSGRPPFDAGGGQGGEGPPARRDRDQGRPGGHPHTQEGEGRRRARRGRRRRRGRGGPQARVPEPHLQRPGRHAQRGEALNLRQPGC